MQRALDVILLRDGDTEGRHDRIAGELLDRAPGGGDLLCHGVVEALEHRPYSLGILRAAPNSRRAGQIGEDDGRELALCVHGSQE